MASEAISQTINLVMDLRPVVWDATMVAPASDAGVTVVVRVTYRTLVEICDDICVVTESAAVRPSETDPAAPAYAGAATFSRFFLSSSAS